MDEASLRNLFERLKSGETVVDEALSELQFMPYVEAGDAKVDHHREHRCGFAEAVYGPGKTPGQLVRICAELMSHADGAVLATRASREHFEAVAAEMPGAVYHQDCGLIVIRAGRRHLPGAVLVASAGTADLPVAEEAALTLEALGATVSRLGDVGVAGLHRLLAASDALKSADVIVAVAGMEGALPNVIAGLVSAPVIAVPTSVGYGAGAGGIAPLLAMLNSCAPGIAVVNIDNGFGAAVFAATVLRAGERATDRPEHFNGRVGTNNHGEG